MPHGWQEYIVRFASIYVKARPVCPPCLRSYNTITVNVVELMIP